ncbi:hypothetical protein B188_10240 [Candidatus Brocadiaceae bacterium B188]|nr:hypothetical protein [Candidatus Brocadia sapporoensis]QQR66137.1 MAG: hypothetical protein IPI25_11445 [Candidatus Brocadia sp.]RZV56500.1 MAG: hypothetical protein EX330_13345 [Candidatus Brocadia sp. BROELEC01]TWU53060.1 hypothetical protein B188_10240 [Candidatus Brocadiaceae bacterium B188]
MKTYLVSLVRSYAVTIEADNEEEACRCAEFFIGDCHDLSTHKDKQNNKFSIIEIEPTFNEAVDVEEAEE